MPMRSKAQNRAMHAAAQGQSTLGIPTGVGKDFVAASHGQDVKALPQKVAQAKAKSKPVSQFRLQKEGKSRR